MGSVKQLHAIGGLRLRTFVEDGKGVGRFGIDRRHGGTRNLTLNHQIVGFGFGFGTHTEVVDIKIHIVGARPAHIQFHLDLFAGISILVECHL